MRKYSLVNKELGLAITVTVQLGESVNEVLGKALQDKQWNSKVCKAEEILTIH